MNVLEGAVTSALNLCSWSEGVKATVEDEGEEGREGGYTGEEEERNAASSGEKPPKRPRQKNRAPQGHRKRSTDDHDEKNELTFSANR